MDIPIKFIIAYFIIYFVTFTVTAYVYSETGEELPEAFTNLTKGKEGIATLPVVGDIVHAMGKLWDLFNIFFAMLIFGLPHIPAELNFIFGVVNAILIFAFMVSIYPFIKGLVDSAIAYFDSITPFT